MVEISELLTCTRFPLGWKFWLMLLYFPVGVFLIVCRVIIAAHCFIVICLFPKNSARGHTLRMMLGVLGIQVIVEEDKNVCTTKPYIVVASTLEHFSQPLHEKTGFLPMQKQSCRSAVQHTLRMMLGVLGIQVMVEDDKNVCTTKPYIVVANYTSVLDHFIIDVVINNIVPYDHGVPAIFQWVLGYKDLGSSQGKQQFLSRIKTFCQESELPVLFHPEELPTNNTGLLKFSTLPFEFEIPVQPVTIQLSRLSFPCALTTIESPKWSDVLWCFFAPITVYKLKVLPVQRINEDESAVVFADRVQGLMAETLGLPATQYTVTEVREYIKRLKTPPPPPVRRVSKPVIASTSKSQLSGSCLDSLDAELRKMIQQVIDVLPQVPVSAVKKDLEVTKDVDITISNLLEGRVPYTEGEDKQDTSNNTHDSELESSTLSFKDTSFSRSPSERHLSFEERKKKMYEVARLRYKQKHKLA